MSLWSERIMVAFPKTHPLAVRDFVYWTDLKNERFLMSRRDPGPEIQDILLNKLASPGDRPLIKQIKANSDHILSVVDGNRGITLTCEVLHRQCVARRDLSRGPRRQRTDAPWLCRLLASQQRQSRSEAVSGSAAGASCRAAPHFSSGRVVSGGTAILLYFFAPLR